MSELLGIFLVVPVLLVFVTTAIGVCGKPNRDIEGLYSTCPQPGFSHATLSLQEGRARMTWSGDRGPNSFDVSGTYSYSEQALYLSLDSGVFRAAGRREQSPQETPLLATLLIREAVGSPVVGPGEWQVEPGVFLRNPFILIKVAEPGEQPPDTVRCPHDVKRWKNQASTG